MRQWVIRSDRYEPTFNESTMQWSVHYDTELIATRPLRPKDKAPVEGLVYKTYQFFYSRIRNEEHEELHIVYSGDVDRKHSTKPLFPISTKQNVLAKLDNLAHLGLKITVR